MTADIKRHDDGALPTWRRPGASSAGGRAVDSAQSASQSFGKCGRTSWPLVLWGTRRKSLYWTCGGATDYIYLSWKFIADYIYLSWKFIAVHYLIQLYQFSSPLRLSVKIFDINYPFPCNLRSLGPKFWTCILTNNHNFLTCWLAPQVKKAGSTLVGHTDTHSAEIDKNTIVVQRPTRLAEMRGVN